MQSGSLAIMLLFLAALAVACALPALGAVCSPRRAGRVKRMPYESGVDPFHDTRRRFDIRFHLLAIAFLVFDVELLFLYPWAVLVGSRAAAAESNAPALQALAPATGTTPASMPASATAHRVRSASRAMAPEAAFFGGMIFIGLLTLGFIYDWKKGIFRWR